MFNGCFFPMRFSKITFLAFMIVLVNSRWQRHQLEVSDNSKNVSATLKAIHTGNKNRKDNIKRAFKEINSLFEKNKQLNSHESTNGSTSNDSTPKVELQSKDPRQLSLQPAYPSMTGQLSEKPRVIENQGQNPDFLINQYYPNTQNRPNQSDGLMRPKENVMDLSSFKKPIHQKINLKSNTIYNDNIDRVHHVQNKHREARGEARKLRVMGQFVNSMMPSNFLSESANKISMINFEKRNSLIPALETENNVIREDIYPAVNRIDARVNGIGFPRYAKQFIPNPQAFEAYEKIDEFKESREKYDDILSTIMELNRAIDNLEIRSQNRSGLIDQRIHQLSTSLNNIVKVQKDSN